MDQGGYIREMLHWEDLIYWIDTPVETAWENVANDGSLKSEETFYRLYIPPYYLAPLLQSKRTRSRRWWRVSNYPLPSSLVGRDLCLKISGKHSFWANYTRTLLLRRPQKKTKPSQNPQKQTVTSRRNPALRTLWTLQLLLKPRDDQHFQTVMCQLWLLQRLIDQIKRRMHSIGRKSVNTQS